MSCNQTGSRPGAKGSADAVRGRSRLHVPGKPRLEGRLHERRPFTLTYHIRPEARWSDGVPVTAQDFIFTLRAIRRHASQMSVTSTPRSEVRVPSIARPCESFCGRGPRAGTTSSGTSCRRTRSAARTSRRSGATGSTIRGRVEPIGSGPFLVERLERGRQLVLRRNPRYWGPHPAYVERLVVRFAQSATDPSEELRSGELDVAMGVPPAAVPAVRRQPGIALRRRPQAPDSSTSTSSSDRTLIRRFATSSFAARSHTGSTAPRSSEQIWGEVDPSARALDSAVHLTRAATTSQLEPYRYRPAEARRLLEQAGCRRGATGSSPAAASGSRCAS